jgi:hypothetical protein
MKARACAVRMSIAVAVMLGSSSLIAIGSNGVAGATSNTKPKVAITSSSVVLSGRTLVAPVTLRCSGAPCAGSVQMTGTVKIKKKMGKRTVTKATSVVLASTGYKLAKGRSGRFNLALTKTGRSSLAKANASSPLRATLIASVKGGATARKSVVVGGGDGSPSSPSVASIESAICAAEFPNGVSGGDHCGVTNLKVSTVDSNWVFAAVGFYNAQDQPENNGTEVILNLSTHQIISAENGFCGEGTGTPVAGYSSIPANVLAGFGLSPCSSTTTTTVPPATTTTTAPPPQSSPCVFESSWSCESTDPTLTIDSYYSGDAGPGCTFTWSIDWGDGSPAQIVTQNGELMGYYFLADYTYQSPSDTTTDTVTVSAVSVTGGCNIYTHVGTFTLIAPGQGG